MLNKFLAILFCVALVACETQGGVDVESNMDDLQVVEAGMECDLTPGDAQGPYFIADAPFRENIVPAGEFADRILISGVVMNEQCEPLSGVTLNVWHAGPDKQYSDEWYRGRILTDKNGFYEFETVYPGQYGIDSGVRPAHIHFNLTHSDYAELNTQLYFAGDPFLTGHDVRGGFESDNPELITTLETDNGGQRGQFNVVLSER